MCKAEYLQSAGRACDNHLMYRPPSGPLRFALFLILPAILLGLTSPVNGQVAGVSGNRQNTGSVSGIVSTQNGSIRLGGASVVLRSDSDAEVANQTADADGQFTVSGLPPGAYRATASFEGFVTRVLPVVVTPGGTVRIDFDLPVAFSATVDVVAPADIAPVAGLTLSSTEVMGSKMANELAPGAGVAGALRLLARVIEMPKGVSIRGGRPTQSGTQLGPIMFADPSLGLTHTELPDDAVDSVSVLSDPYAVEYGRFSSGLVLIQTRRAGDEWKVRLNNLNPVFWTERYKDWKVKGISGLSPQLEIGGPLIKNKLFLEQTAQYQYSSSDVSSLPQDERRTTNTFSAFTRVDANLSDHHSLTGTIGVFPKTVNQASLGTFTPPGASVNLHDELSHESATERAVWHDNLVSESTFQMDHYRTTLSGQGSLPMQLWPDTTFGNFYNVQNRRPSVFQAVQTLSGSTADRLGQHLFKVGIDILSSRYAGTSLSRPVLIYRGDGTLARRLDFSGFSRQDVRSTDVALFAQDRIAPSSRWFIEFGGRLDRDGVLQRWNMTPRIGAVVVLNEAATSVLRGGVGLFYERTPSLAGAFQQFEITTDTRYDLDGVTPLGPPIRFPHVLAPDLGTARSMTWDVAYDYRVNNRWSLHAGVLDRHGSRELLVNPVVLNGAGQLVLSSDGSSQYQDVEVGVEYTHGQRAELSVTYAKSIARSDLNAFANYFDTMMQPVIGANGYGSAPTDVPYRVLARGRLMPTSRWLLIGILDVRAGLPYSIVNDALDFVGARNTMRFPNVARLDLGIERRFHIGKFQPWIGIRANNALDAFLPSDVQSNLSSPNFGRFYNSPVRALRLQVRFER
jgi:hypothetical protein